MMSSHNSGSNYSGTCLMDYTTLDGVADCLDFCCSNSDWYLKQHVFFDPFEYQIQKGHYMRCLINFVEALVLQEEIYVPYLTMGKHFGGKLVEAPYIGPFRKLPNFFRELFQKGIIKELRIDRELTQNLISAYEEYANSEGFARKFSGAIQNIGNLYTYNGLLRISHSSSGNPFFKWNEFINEPEFKVTLESTRRRIAKGRLKFLLEGDPEPLLLKLGRFMLRGFAYNEIAKIEGIPYLPHPLRAIFSMSEGLWSCNSTREWGTVAIRYMDDFRRDYVASLGSNIFEIDVPFVFANIIRQCQQRSDIIPIALQVRNLPASKAFRQWNKDLTEAIYNNEGKKVEAALRELKNLRQELAKEWGQKNDKFTANLWMISYEIKVPDFLYKITNQLIGRRHIQFLHDYMNRSINIISLNKELERVFYE